MLRAYRLSLYSLSRQASSSSASNNMQDHYLTLGVNRKASAKEIKTAFYELSKKYHPDRNPENKEQVAVKFQNIMSAYEILSNVDKRKFYDSQLLPPQYQSPMSGNYEHREEDIQDLNARFRDLERTQRTSRTRELYYANTMTNRLERWGETAKNTTNTLPFKNTDLGVSWDVARDLLKYFVGLLIMFSVLRGVCSQADYSQEEPVEGSSK